MNNENNDQIQDIPDDINERFVLAENGVDSSIQQEYLEYTRNFDFSKDSAEDVSARSHRLFDPDASIEDKKEILAVFAHQGTVESYRSIERFIEIAGQELRDWAMLALQECRMFLESSLLDRNTGIMMTGLGGENNRLRYFLVIRPKGTAVFTIAHRAAITQGFTHICGRFNSILEEIQEHRDYTSLKLVIPLNVAIAQVIEEGINECNKDSDFLDENYYVTNERIPTEAEIFEYLREIGKA